MEGMSLMARMPSIEQRLEMWSIWKDRESRGSLGYPRQSSFCHERVDGGHAEVQIQIYGHEEGITDQAVAALKLSHPKLHLAIWLHYIGSPLRLTVIGVAKACCVTPDTIYRWFGDADRAIAQWLQVRDDQKNNFERSKESVHFRQAVITCLRA